MQRGFTNRVVLVHIDFSNYKISNEDIGEFHELVKATDIEIVSLITFRSEAPRPRYFIGSGKAEEIRILVEVEKANLVIFNCILTPSQERNLERLFQCRVMDRIGLILDIFAQRARSFEGRLQVELAQLQYLSTRLIRGWSHLERQKGGIGLRGPGETQLELDRRSITNRIKVIKKRLQKVRLGRQQARRARQHSEIPIVSLVGYTNVGKSTLFNKLTAADVHIADQLFATLDPVLRRIELSEVGPIILVDTVGFIRHLPTGLIEAFQATLEETMAGDLLLHVVDASDPLRREKIAAVNNVLQQINAQKIPQLLVYNKIDLTKDNISRINYDNFNSNPKSVKISAVTGEGLDLLLGALKILLFGEIKEYKFTLKPSDGKLRAALYRLGTVLSEKISRDGNWQLIVRLKKQDFERLFANF
ncbi:MAG: GTPase HflX [Coxiella sp. DG_40]|nr:MAG: GTPase HflX [Coxiella sp. DG_40]